MTAKSLVDRVHATIAGGSHESFNTLACDVFRSQVSGCAAWANLCAHRGVVADDILDWRDIPPMPVGVFRQAVVSTRDPDNCGREQGGACFQSSGTTQRETSRHWLDSEGLALYRASLRAGYRLALGAQRSSWPVLALALPPEQAPASSLSEMLGCLVSENGGAFYDIAPGSASRLKFRETLEALDKPVVLFGTAFAWVHVFDDDPGWRTRLPEGTLVVETGGTKGRSREISQPELYREFRRRLGVPDGACVSEYGMCELTSQFWGFGCGAPKAPPPWLKSVARDPFTDAPLPPGVPGVLCHVDLANVHSAVAVRTGDWGSVDGDGRVVLHGRAPGAPIRGCSLVAEFGNDFDVREGDQRRSGRMQIP